LQYALSGEQLAILVWLVRILDTGPPFSKSGQMPGGAETNLASPYVLKLWRGATTKAVCPSSYGERDETDAIAEVESEVTNDNKDSGGLL
jgi:hypothetical protein